MFGLINSLKSVRNMRQLAAKCYTHSSGAKVEDQFQRAQQNLKKLSEEPPNDVKLRLYALFKQSTIGQCNTAKPSALQMVEKAKWGAWSSLGSMANTDAMTQYVDTVNQLLKDGGIDPQSAEGSQAVAEPPGLLVENRSGVCVISLNRPKKYNAITLEMYESWIQALNTASSDESVKLAMITGTGDYYCAGNDLKNFERGFALYKGDMKLASAGAAKILQKFVAAFIDFQKPLIAVVNGPALGLSVTTLGLCDCAIASDTAYFHTPFTSLGQSAEGCATFTFPYIMGVSKASEMLYFNHKMSAKEALDCGLISRIVPSGELRAHVEEWVFGPKGLINTCYPKSMQLSKALVRNEEMRMRLHQINKDECDLITERWVSEECLEALQKFATRKQSNL